MQANGSRVVNGVARVFSVRPDRVAAAWRRLRHARGGFTVSLLEGLVEPFVREIGRTLQGQPGSPWQRTGGVLRLSPQRGARALHEEFATLRRCLLDAVQVLGGTAADRQLIELALREAADSAVCHFQQLVDPTAEPPRHPFGGLVVEFYDQAATGSRSRRLAAGEIAVH